MIATSEGAGQLTCWPSMAAGTPSPCLGPKCAAWRWLAGPGHPFEGGWSVRTVKTPSPPRPVGGCGALPAPTYAHLRVAGLVRGRAGIALGLPVRAADFAGGGSADEGGEHGDRF